MSDPEIIKAQNLERQLQARREAEKSMSNLDQLRVQAEEARRIAQMRDAR